MNSVYIPKIQRIDTSEFLKENLRQFFRTDIQRIDIVQCKTGMFNSAFIHFKSELPPDISERIDAGTFSFIDNSSKNKFRYIFKRNNAPIPEYPDINNSQICENFKIQGELIIKLSSALENTFSIIESLKDRIEHLEKCIEK
jgi:hypothetical protein